MLYPVNTECIAHSNSVLSSIFKMKSTFHFKSPRDNWSAFLLCNGFGGGGYSNHSSAINIFTISFVSGCRMTPRWFNFCTKPPKIKTEGHLGSWQGCRIPSRQISTKRRWGPEWTPELRTLSSCFSTLGNKGAFAGKCFSFPVHGVGSEREGEEEI